MNISRKTLLYSSLVFLVLFFGVFITDVKADSNAVLFFDTPSKTFSKGDEINVSILVKTFNQTINAVSGSFKIPKNFKLENIQTAGSILDFWVAEPKVENGIIAFQGVSIKQPYQGNSGLVFSIKGIVTASGSISFSFNDGTILADDGKGTNVLGSLASLALVVKNDLIQNLATNNVAPNASNISSTNKVEINNQSLALNNVSTVPEIVPPVVTSISPPIDQSQSFSITGKGLPNALTQIKFQDISDPSFGRSFVNSLVRDRVPLTDVELKNDSSGAFSYVSPNNLVAGVYDAVPSYVNPDNKNSVIGYGTKVFITDNIIYTILLVVVNSVVLIFPIVALVLIVVFLPWYFERRFRSMDKKAEVIYTTTKHKIVKLLAFIIGAEASLVMTGWILGVDKLTRISHFGTNMKLPTALTFFVSAWGLYFISRSMKKEEERSRIIVLGISFVIFMIIFSLLVISLSGEGTGIEKLFINSQSSSNSFGADSPSLMAVVGFILFGIVSMFSFFTDPGRYNRLKFFGYAILIIGLIPIFGYMFHNHWLYYQFNTTAIPMALNTALAFVLLGFGLIIVGQTKNTEKNKAKNHHNSLHEKLLKKLV